MTVYDELNALESREPRHCVEINDGTNTWYFTSHADIVTPDAARTYHSCLVAFPISSQKIDPLQGNSEIGTGAFELIDVDDNITTFLSDEFAADITMRKKQAAYKTGFRGMEYSEFDTVGAQIIDSTISVMDDRYKFKTADLQRTIKNSIFNTRKTNLSAVMDDTQLYVYVADPSDFETIYHDANFTHLPSTEVSYIKIDKEVISWTAKVDTAISVSGTDISFSSADDSMNSAATSPLTTDLSVFSVGQAVELSGTTNAGIFTVASVTATKVTFNETIVTEAAGSTESPERTVTAVAEPQFYNCTRGVLNTRPSAHNTDLTVSVDRRTEVNEWIYLETNILKIIYGILTGIWFGTAYVWPSNWHQDIDTTLIEDSQFTAHPDLWDTSDDSGFIVRFEGEKEQVAKKFLELQCNFLAGGFLQVLGNGKIGFKRSARVITGASPVAEITNRDVYKKGPLDYALRDVSNFFQIEWNYDPQEEKTTRKSPIIDLNSIAKYEIGDKTYKYQFRGLHGSKHTLQTVYNIADMIRDRYSAYPKMIIIEMMPGKSGYQVGQILKLNLTNVKDHTNSDTNRLNSSFEIQGKRYNPSTGRAIYTLFGSSEAATPVDYYDGDRIPDAFFTSVGTDISAGSPLPLVGTSSGGTYTVTASGTLTGNADLTNSAARYYCPENLTINSDVIVTMTQNVYLCVLGHLTINGKFDLKGQGLTGGSGYTTAYRHSILPYYTGVEGTSGFIGDTESGGSIAFGHSWYSDQIIDRGSETTGKNSTAPYLHLKNTVTGSPETPVLEGVPTDLRGTSGGSGGSISRLDGRTVTLLAQGGDGGNGGGGLFIVCRGMSFGVNGEIDSRGDEGNLGAYDSSTQTYAGTGATGSPGAVYVVIDNGTQPANNLVAEQVQPAIQGEIWPVGERLIEPWPRPATSGYVGSPTNDMQLAAFRVQIAPKNEAEEQDISAETSPPTAITATDGTATQNNPNSITVFLGATAPADTNYDYANIYIQESGRTGWELVGQSAGTTDLAPAKELKPSTTYNIKAHGVSIASDGQESPDYYETTHTTPAITSTVDQNVKQNNTNALYSDAIFINGVMSNIVAIESVSGNWSISKGSSASTLSNTSTDTTTAADDYIDRLHDITTPTWEKYRYFEVVAQSTSANETAITTGRYEAQVSTITHHFGFYFYTDGNIYATWANGTTQYTQSLQAFTDNTDYLLRAEFTPPTGSPLAGGEILFYVDDTLRHTASTSAEMPTGTTAAAFMVSRSAYKSTTSTATIRVGEVKVYQAP